MKIVIAGGGSGGHIFPGVAVAEEFKKRSALNEVLFMAVSRLGSLLPNWLFEVSGCRY